MRMNNRGINMNKKEMLERLEAGYSPVAVSKEKWINIRDNDTELKMDTNSDNCGLCYVNHSYCDICSLYKATGHGCSDGAWYRYSEFRDEHRHYNGYNYVGDDFDEDERKQLAQDMIDELDTVEKWEQKQKCKEQTLNKEIDEVNFPLIEAVEPYEQEDAFEVEKVEIKDPEFVEVKPKEIQKVEKFEPIEEKEPEKKEELPEWKPVEPKNEKVEEIIIKKFEDKKTITDDELTEWEPVETEVKRVEEEKIEEKIEEKPVKGDNFCGHCGAKIEDEGNFCAECGKGLNNNFKEIVEEKPEPVEKEEQVPVFIPVKQVEDKEEPAKLEEESIIEEPKVEIKEEIV